MAPADRGVVLEVENLQTEFHLRSTNVKAVDGVSFTVAEGECVGLVGESGCGKSTTGLSIMKLLPTVGHVTGGSVKLLGRDLLPLPESEMRKVRGNDVVDDLPGSDDVAEPDVDGRAPDRRGRPAAPRRHPEAGAASGRARCSSSSACRGRTSGSATTRISSPAACASA